MAAERKSPLAERLKQKAEMINTLLNQYQTLRFGDETFRKGDNSWRKGKTENFKICQKCHTAYKEKDPRANCKCGGELKILTVRIGIPPGHRGVPPQIMVASSPRNIYSEEQEQPIEENEEDAAEQENDASSSPGQDTEAEPTQGIASPMETNETGIRIVNPLAQALVGLGEMTTNEAHKFELDVKYTVLTELGVEERYNCTVLLPWARQLAAHITYILETREIYSAEIKAIYPELLNDLEVARSSLDHLAYLLGRQHGLLSNRQFAEMMSKILHYAEVSKQAALQLADHHLEFVTAETSPLEGSPEITWVMKEMEGAPTLPKEKEEKPKDESEEE
jgi:hypothetical protein